MRQIKEVLRLRFVCERSQSEIARTIGASKATVWEYLDRVRRAQLSYERATSMDDAALEALLFPPAPPSNRERPKPAWPTVHRELGKKGVTLDLLWNEYKAQPPEGYGYSWFCEHYERWAATLPVTLRQTHAPGEKLFVDYSGNKCQRHSGIDTASAGIGTSDLIHRVVVLLRCRPHSVGGVLLCRSRSLHNQSGASLVA